MIFAFPAGEGDADELRDASGDLPVPEEQEFGRIGGLLGPVHVQRSQHILPQGCLFCYIYMQSVITIALRTAGPAAMRKLPLNSLEEANAPPDKQITIAPFYFYVAITSSNFYFYVINFLDFCKSN